MNKQLPIKREFSAGAVVFKKIKINNQSSIINHQFLLGKHSGYHKWVLPKGLIEKDEKGWQTAIRETEEEMGVKAKLVSQKPIYIVRYVYVADYHKSTQHPASSIQTINRPKRRVKKYQEEGGKKVKVFKTVSFYLAVYKSGSPRNHGWEMEDAGWFEYKKALEKLAFQGEKEVLRKAQSECII